MSDKGVVAALPASWTCCPVEAATDVSAVVAN